MSRLRAEMISPNFFRLAEVRKPHGIRRLNLNKIWASQPKWRAFSRRGEILAPGAGMTKRSEGRPPASDVAREGTRGASPRPGSTGHEAGHAPGLSGLS